MATPIADAFAADLAKLQARHEASVIRHERHLDRIRTMIDELVELDAEIARLENEE